MMLGGRRPGAGRPPAESPAKHNVGARLTDQQYAKWLELGGSRWLKRMIENASANGKRQSDEKCE